MSEETSIYYPPPESLGEWRYLTTGGQVRQVAGMDPEKLELVRQSQEFLFGGDSWGIVVIRHGYLVREFYTLVRIATHTRGSTFLRESWPVLGACSCAMARGKGDNLLQDGG
jgi:hypothetical protein